ncbi:hypothetical protein BTN50_0300 [Candidatus Enterovibrio altilux]|uniref:Uncharacterized protein n=1 Tax=Candidatus Enterovibrio altilux TaxID=1927128 RepID=A0A291B774_9GAMM|nr:hypothetical protein BTN50_0300 [Candidatus Enterovibrio luxaltus]
MSICVVNDQLFFVGSKKIFSQLCFLICIQIANPNMIRY